MSPAPVGPYSQEPQLLKFRIRLSRSLDRAEMTPGDLAREVGKSRQVVWQWMSGARIPNAVSIVRIARVLGVPADWLLGEPPACCAERVVSLARKMADETDGPSGEQDEETRTT